MANVKKIRKRTIGYQPRPTLFNKIRFVPALQLAGVWLEKAGFETGDQVEVVVKDGEIIIRLN